MKGKPYKKGNNTLRIKFILSSRKKTGQRHCLIFFGVPIFHRCYVMRSGVSDAFSSCLSPTKMNQVRKTKANAHRNPLTINTAFSLFYENFIFPHSPFFPFPDCKLLRISFCRNRSEVFCFGKYYCRFHSRWLLWKPRWQPNIHKMVRSSIIFHQ